MSTTIQLTAMSEIHRTLCKSVPTLWIQVYNGYMYGFSWEYPRYTHADHYVYMG